VIGHLVAWFCGTGVAVTAIAVWEIVQALRHPPLYACGGCGRQNVCTVEDCKREGHDRSCELVTGRWACSIPCWEYLCGKMERDRPCHTECTLTKAGGCKCDAPGELVDREVLCSRCRKPWLFFADIEQGK
jgi:hypothetical protein